MITQEASVHFIPSSLTHHVAIFENNGFHVLFQTDSKSAEAKKTKIAQKISDNFYGTGPLTLKDFTDLFKDLSEDSSILSFAATYCQPLSLEQKETPLYIYTLKGVVLIKRDGALYKVAHGSQEITGTTNPGDVLILSTQPILPGLQLHIKNNHSLKDIIHSLTEHEKSSSKTGALLIHDVLERELIEKSVVPHPQEPPLPFAMPSVHKEAKYKKPFPFPKFQPRLLGGIIVFIIIIGILFKITATIQKTMAAQRETRFNQTLEKLLPQLDEVKKNMAKNPSTQLAALEKIENQAQKLVKEYPDKKQKLNPLLTALAQIKKTIGNGKAPKEKIFFDLALIDKNAHADRMEVSDSKISILDIKNKRAYSIAIETKQHETFSLSKITNPKLIAANASDVFVYDPGKGVYKLTTDGAELVVAQDKEVGEVIDMRLFNSNIYLLDRKNDEIYKHVPTEAGYSDKISYFQPGGSRNLSTAQKIAIDFSLYLLIDGTIIKYTAGAKDALNLQDSDDMTLSSLYKDQDTDYLYGLDNDSSRVVAFDKKGKLVKSLFNSKLKDSLFFGVHKDEQILFLGNDKVYVLDKF